MSKRWLTVLLVISFIFNLAVVFSYVYYKVIAPPPPPSARNMPHFSPRDRIRTPDPETLKLNKRFNSLKINLMEELAKDPINETRIAAIIDSSVVTQNDLERQLGKKLLENRKKMTAMEAKEHFLKRAEFLKNRAHRKNYHRNRR